MSAPASKQTFLPANDLMEKHILCVMLFSLAGDPGMNGIMPNKTSLFRN